MNVILALCLFALAPLTPWGRSVDARAAPNLHVATSESWEFEESTESQEDAGLDQGSHSRKHNLAELLLPYIQRELTESRPLISKKNAKTAHVNSRKKHVVEITPLRGKGRDGKPLAYILAPAKADLRRALAKRIDKHHITHENKNHDSYRTQTKSLIVSSSEEDSSEEVTVKAGKLIPFGESKELGSSADVSKETVIFDKTTSHKESKQPSSREVASEEENVVSGKSTSIKEETESDSSGDSSKDGSINSDTSTLLEEQEKSSFNKDYSEEEKSDKSVSLAESENAVSKDNADEASVKSNKSVSIEEPNESISSKDDTENIVKLDRTPSITETEESGSSNDVKEEEPVTLDKIISIAESTPSSSRANDTKEDTTPIVETKEYRSNEGDSKVETGKSDNATLLDQPSESRSGEDVTEVNTVKFDSVENSTSVEEPIISKYSTDQTDNTVHDSFKDRSSSGHTSDSEESVADLSSPTLINMENEGSNDGSSDFISYKQDSDVNVSDLNGKASSTDDSSDSENYDIQQDNENQLSEGKQTEEENLEPEHIEVKTAKDKLNSNSLHKSHDEKKYASHSHNEQISSEINAEENLAESKNVEKSETQQTQHIQIKKSKSKLNENSTNADQDKNELHVTTHTDKTQKKHDKVKYEDIVHLRNHYNHRNHDHHHRELNISDPAEDLKVFETEDQKYSSLQRSHKDENSADKQGIAISDEINDMIPVENVNELKDKPEEAKSEYKNEKETNASDINEKQAANKFEGEKTNIKIEDETQIDKHSEHISRNEDLEQSKSETPTVINKNEVSESDISVENTEEEGKLQILTPGNESVVSKVEKTTEITTIEVLNEQSERGQQAEGNKLEESTEQANTIELVGDGENLTEKNNTSKTDTDIQIGNHVEINKTELVLEENKPESLIKESKPSEPVADSEIGSEIDNTEEESKKENSLEESKIEAVQENNIDEVADKDTTLEERYGNTEDQSSVSASSGKNKIEKIKNLYDQSSVEDSETIFTHSHLRTVSSKLPNDGIIITKQDGLNNIWKPESQNVIELIQSPPCQPRGEDSSDRAPLEHKTYRLSFLFNK